MSGAPSYRAVSLRKFLMPLFRFSTDTCQTPTDVMRLALRLEFGVFDIYLRDKWLCAALQ